MAGSTIKTFQTGYREHFQEFKSVDADRNQFINQLIEEIDALRLETQESSRDLLYQKSRVHDLQKELFNLKPKYTGKDFVLVLLDADADDYIFQERFLNRDAEGGREAADELVRNIKRYIDSLQINVETTDIMTRAYANMSGLQTACVQNKKMKLGASMKLFAQGFTQRRALFDFVDVGPGKEQADNKIRECLRLFLSNAQCKHIILGVCHDSGYAPFLSGFASDPTVRNRITLLGGSKAHPEIQKLGFTWLPTDAVSVFAAHEVRPKSPPVKLTPVNPNHSPAGSTSPKSASSAPQIRINPKAFTERLELRRDDKGKRIDKPLNVDPTSSYLNYLRQHQFCTYYYLRGRCEVDCGRSHKPGPLTTKEYDYLWYLTRKNLCHKIRKGKDCCDPMCVYGHEAS